MTRKERLMNTLRGARVDRPAFNFYEINGLEDRSPADPFNIYSDPSWRALLDLAAEKTDRIVMRSLPINKNGDAQGWQAMPELEARTERSFDENGSELSVRTMKAGKRILTERARRDRDVNTVWITEHLLKDLEDFKAWLEIPEPVPNIPEVDTQAFLDLEAQVGETGLVMLDTNDPLCGVAALFDMAEYTIIAMAEPDLFHKALQRQAKALYPQIEAVAKALPGRLWRIYGPEYASPPYLPPHLFHDYVTEYVRPIVAMIHKHGGYARIHAHGRLKDVLDHIAATGCDGLDPIEPPRQGDVELSYVRGKYGRQLVLFGNLEITDIENMPTCEFEGIVRKALKDGIGGRGFVLMPSACPYGRKIPALTMRNYEAIARCVEELE